MSSIRKYALTCVAVAALAVGSAGTALAYGHGGGHWGGGGGHWGGGHWGGGHGYWGGGWGGFGAGLALGALATAPYWGGYGYAPYGYYDDYGPECYIRRRIVIRHGVEYVRRVRVCY